MRQKRSRATDLVWRNNS